MGCSLAQIREDVTLRSVRGGRATAAGASFGDLAEESPSTDGQERLLTAGRGDPTESATEKIPLLDRRVSVTVH